MITLMASFFVFFQNRFRLYASCSDDSECIPIVWPDDEVSRLLGKTVYEVDADHTEVIP